MKNIAVFASGRGSNFSAIVSAQKRGVFKANVSLLVCDNSRAKVLKRAKKAKIKTALIKRQDFPSKEKFEAEIIKRLRKENVELIALAGFMRILSPAFVHKYKNRILNIHPALLPAYKGAEAIKDAFKYGAKATGVTVHFVDEKTDHGPIILQEPVKIEKTDTLKSLEEKIHKIERKLYPEAIRLYLEGKLKVTSRKVKIL